MGDKGGEEVGGWIFTGDFVFPKEYFENLLEEFKKEHPFDPLNRPMKSAFLNSEEFKSLIKPFTNESTI